MAKSLQTEFVKYYKEKLEPFGFQKVRGRQPYFVRVINDEIIHVITYMGGKSTKPGYKELNLMCGIATVYKKEINFAVSPTQNSDWLLSLGTICEMKDTEYPVVNFPRDFKEFYYNDNNILEVIESTYEGVKILINELDKVSNTYEVLRHVLKYVPKDITFRRALDDSCFDEEGLFFARKEYDENLIAKAFEDKSFDLKNSGWDEAKKQKTMKGILEWEKRLKIARSEFIENDAEYQQGMKFLIEHYELNIGKLIKYGLDVQKREVNL